MAKYHHPNPFDLYFLALHRVSQRMGLAGSFSQIHLLTDGKVDVEGMKQAMMSLYRRYPAAAGRLTVTPFGRRPAWRLDGPLPDPSEVVHLHHIETPTDEAKHTFGEALLSRSLDIHGQRPFHLHVLRGGSSGDVVIARYPHTLMDGRGGTTMLEELQALYHDPQEPTMVESAGDELRDDFTRLFAEMPRWKRMAFNFSDIRGAPVAGSRAMYLTKGPTPSDAGPVRYFVRTLTVEQTKAAKTMAMRVCGFARFGGFLRACGIRALDRVIPRPHPAGATYSTGNLVDYRKRRDRKPVCHNLVAWLPIYIPAEMAPDRRAVADLFLNQSHAQIESGVLQRRLAQMHAMTRLPVGWLSRIMYRVETKSRRVDPAETSDQPSLVLGMIGPARRPMTHFCGAELRNIYGTHPISPRGGFAIDVNESHNQLNICAMYVESRVPTETMHKLVDELVSDLLSAE